jgi:polysaccharide pyruvyl transferase WcaK-like protein
MFQKHNQQHRYSTLADFQSLLLKLRESSESGDSKQVNIFVIGHSLDKSDHTKLKHLFTENKNAKITIFYHDEESFQRYINNITEILGESDVAVRVRFYHQNNQPNGLLLPYWCFDDGRISYSIIDLADDQISEILTDYFISNKIPDILDELSTHKSSRLRPNPSIVLNLLMRKILQSMVQDISKLNCKLVLIAI